MPGVTKILRPGIASKTSKAAEKPIGFELESSSTVRRHFALGLSGFFWL